MLPGDPKSTQGDQRCEYGVPDTILQMWDFEEAPDNLRRLVPLAYAGGWVALISYESANELADSLMRRCKDSGLSLIRYDLDNAGILLAGHHIDILLH